MVIFELIKLLIIVFLGIFVIIFGFYLQRKKLNKKSSDQFSNQNRQISLEEEKIRDYILTYKNNYSKDALFNAISKMNIPKEKILEYLNKYF